MRVSKLYLAAYNAASIAGWAYVILQIVQHFIAHRENPAAAIPTLYKHIEQPLKIVQTAAVLEIFHAMFGLVRAALFTTIVQVFSRLAVLWLISNISPPSQVHWSFALMAASWSAVEVPRYGFLLWKLLVDSDGKPKAAGAAKPEAEETNVPYFMLWLRYSLFMVLYPTGITGELGQLLTSMPYVREHRLLSVRMPNEHNVAFDYSLMQWVLLALYVPGSYIMYTHMLAQRRSKLTAAPKVKAQ